MEAEDSSEKFVIILDPKDGAQGFTETLVTILEHEDECRKFLHNTRNDLRPWRWRQKVHSKR
jgi:hypothetical protein